MKNFTLVLVVMMMGITNAKAATQKTVTCTSNSNASIFLQVVLDDSVNSNIGGINYKFSYAAILCDSSRSLSKIKSSSPFRCAALYPHDTEEVNKVSNSVETVVEVNFTPSTVSDYEVEFMTNHNYGDLAVKLNCEVM